jgi:hypothetical protein
VQKQVYKECFYEDAYKSLSLAVKLDIVICTEAEECQTDVCKASDVF